MIAQVVISDCHLVGAGAIQYYWLVKAMLHYRGNPKVSAVSGVSIFYVGLLPPWREEMPVNRVPQLPSLKR